MKLTNKQNRKFSSMQLLTSEEQKRTLCSLWESETKNNWALQPTEATPPTEEIVKTKSQKLPNIWTLCEEFTKDHPNFKYCTYYHTFYFYHIEELIWKPLEKIDANNMIIKWLKKTYKEAYKKFQPRRLEDLLIILQSETRFSMQKAKAEANKNGFLIPFKNGVLNSVTKVLLNHDPLFYCTHIIAVPYNSEQSIVNTPISEFLSQFVEFKPLLLNLLRAFLNIILTNNTRYQVAMHIYGTGGTVKSTLINILLYLIGPEASFSTSLQNLNSRFGLSKLYHKIFLVISDMTHFKGKEPKLLKEIITGDSVENEKKYRNSISIIHHVIIAITSNSVWEILNPTGGINRRVVYFPSDYLLHNKNLNLFHLTPFGTAEGKILPHLPGLINWILSCPQEYLDSLQAGGENLSKLINPENIIGSHHLDTWIEGSLINVDKGRTQIGNSKSGLDTLYGNYLNWCRINNIEPPIKINRFSDLLLDSLKTLKWTIEKKRLSSGYFIIGVKIKAEENLNEARYKNNHPQINLGHSTEELKFNNENLAIFPVPSHSKLKPLKVQKCGRPELNFDNLNQSLATTSYN